MLTMMAAAASYGLVTPLAKLAATQLIPVGLFTSFQYPLALVVFGLAVLFSRRRFGVLTARDWGQSALVGAFGAGTALTYYQALLRVPASLGIILLFQFAWILPVLTWMIDGVRPNTRQWMAIAGIVAGTALAAGLGGAASASWAGILLGLGAGLSYALMLLVQNRSTGSGSVWMRSWISSLAAGLIVVIVYRPWTLIGGHPHWTAALGYGTLIGLAGQSLPLLLVYLSAPALGGALTAILASFELPVAILLSALWLHEPVGRLQWLGVLLMLAALVWGSLPDTSSA